MKESFSNAQSFRYPHYTCPEVIIHFLNRVHATGSYINLPRAKLGCSVKKQAAGRFSVPGRAVAIAKLAKTIRTYLRRRSSTARPPRARMARVAGSGTTPNPAIAQEPLEKAPSASNIKLPSVPSRTAVHPLE